jgi:hypothetical protein
VRLDPVTRATVLVTLLVLLAALLFAAARTL